MRHRLVNITFVSVLVLLAIGSIYRGLSWWYAVAVFIAWTAVVFAGSAWIGSQYHVRAYCSAPNEKRRRIALTFDDGPTIFTIPILELLRGYAGKATFFCIGKQVEEHPEILRQIIDEGHVVGNHSFFHGRDFDFKNGPSVLRELRDTDAAILKHGGVKPKFFRPPYGVTNPSIRRALEQTGHTVIGWNVRSMDGISQDGQAILKRLRSQIRPGAIVLLHDTSAVTVSVLEQLLLTLREQNYELVTVAELLEMEAYED